MMPLSNDYVVQVTQSDVTLSGVFRFASLAHYDEVFHPIKALFDHPSPVTIHLHQVVFLNSTGITALARLVIAARSARLTLTIKGNKDAQWQHKMLGSLCRLYGDLHIVME